MRSRNIYWGIAGSVSALVAALVFLLPSRHQPISSPSDRVPTSSKANTRIKSRKDDVPKVGANHLQPATPERALRDMFRNATDYAKFVRNIRPLAAGGNTEAQYLTAKAVRYCDDTLKLYFKNPDHRARELSDVQAQRALRSAGISQQALSTIYTRCQGFLADPSQLTEGGTWQQWLNKASDAGHPAAQAQTAADVESGILGVSVDSVSIDPPQSSSTQDQARSAAIAAAASGDPDAIFLMSGWVRSSNSRSPEETAALIGAWQIVACEQNYDCDSNSDWMQAVCVHDQQCNEGETYTEYFQSALGNQYDQALYTAGSIRQALEAKDIPTLQSFL